MRTKKNWLSWRPFLKIKMKKVNGTLMPAKKLYRRFGTQEWYSFCSRHLNYDETCDACLAGGWHNRFDTGFMKYLHKHHYKLWYKIVNRKSKREGWLRRFGKYFPNLK